MGLVSNRACRFCLGVSFAKVSWRNKGEAEAFVRSAASHRCGLLALHDNSQMSQKLKLRDISHVQIFVYAGFSVFNARNTYKVLLTEIIWIAAIIFNEKNVSTVKMSVQQLVSRVSWPETLSHHIHLLFVPYCNYITSHMVHCCKGLDWLQRIKPLLFRY